jgi:hypothetical protein
MSRIVRILFVAILCSSVSVSLPHILTFRFLFPSPPSVHGYPTPYLSQGIHPTSPSQLDSIQLDSIPPASIHRLQSDLLQFKTFWVAKHQQSLGTSDTSINTNKKIATLPHHNDQIQVSPQEKHRI